MKHPSRLCLPLLTLVMALPLGGCGDKAEPPTPEVAQQSPVKEELKQQVSEKIAALLKKADAGDAEAQADLGELYASGEGLPKDAARAADLFRQAAEKGIARAQFRLGQLYVRGEGVPKDGKRAAELIRQSASNGHAKAQAYLAAMYARGENIERDDVLALVWASLAAAQGEKDAEATRDSIKLDDKLREEAERLKAKWQRGLEILREKQQAAVPAQASTSPATKW